VKSWRKLWMLSWRLAICGLLLAWIFQAIFYDEGKVAWTHQERVPAWDALTKVQRLEIAWTYGPPELLRTVEAMAPGGLLLSLVFMGLTILIGVFRWQNVLHLQQLNLPLARIAQISFVAQFFNSFLLGSTGGDVLKAYYVARETHHKKTEAVVTVLVDRVVGLFSMLLFACLFMIPNRALIESNKDMRLLAIMVVAMMLACGGFLVMAFWSGFSRGFPSARHWLRKLPKGPVLERSVDACRQFGRDPLFLCRILLLSMLLNGMCVMQFYALTRAFHVHISLQVLAALVPMVTAVASLPITPSGLGVRENLFVVTLTAPGIALEPKQALLLSLMAYAGFLFWSALGGVVYATLKERERLDEIAKESETE
jgi:uncharacterized protein (TIRG00374 family)